MEKNNVEIIRKYIEISKDSLNSETLKGLVKSEEDIAFLKQCVENRNALGIQMVRDLATLIEATALLGDTTFIKETVKNYKKYELNELYVVKLIKATNDVEYIKFCIEHSENFNLKEEGVTRLIKATNDVEYIKSCIENVRNKKDLKLGNYNISRLIAYTKDKEFIKKCVENFEEYGLKTWSRVYLFGEINDIEYVEKAIINWKEYRLTNEQVIDLVTNIIKDVDFLKYIIEKREEYQISDNMLLYLIEEKCAEDDIVYFIENKDKYKLSNHVLLKLLIKTNNPKYIKDWIEGHKEDLQMNEIISLLPYTEDIAYIYSFEEKILEFISKNLKETKKIYLPENMTIGVEIESEGILTEKIKDVIDCFIDDYYYWDVDTDGSLEEGVEIKSPKFSSDDKVIIRDLYKICAFLKSEEQKITPKCGGHIHIGADYLTDVESYKILNEIWANVEKLLYIIGNAENTLPRKGVIDYAMPISNDLRVAIQEGQLDLYNEEDLNEFVTRLKDLQAEEKAKSINFLNVFSKDKNTIEIRIPNGTIDPDIWIENINLFGGIIKTAQDIFIIKNQKILTPEEKEKFQCYELLKSKTMGDEEKLELLLKLVLPEELRETYRKRYEKNIELWNENNGVRLQLEVSIPDENIQFNRKEIGKTLFTQKDAITGKEYDKIEKQIGLDIQTQEIREWRNNNWIN